jgi:hypothetical protein
MRSITLIAFLFALVVAASAQKYQLNKFRGAELENASADLPDGEGVPILVRRLSKTGGDDDDDSGSDDDDDSGSDDDDDSGSDDDDDSGSDDDDDSGSDDDDEGKGGSDDDDDSGLKASSTAMTTTPK